MREVVLVVDVETVDVSVADCDLRSWLSDSEKDVVSVSLIVADLVALSESDAVLNPGEPLNVKVSDCD